MVPLKAAGIEFGDGLRAQAHPLAGTPTLPAWHGRLRGIDQGLRLTNRIAHTERGTIGRDLGADPVALAGLVKFKALP